MLASPTRWCLEESLWEVSSGEDEPPRRVAPDPSDPQVPGILQTRLEVPYTWMTRETWTVHVLTDMASIEWVVGKNSRTKKHACVTKNSIGESLA